MEWLYAGVLGLGVLAFIGYALFAVYDCVREAKRKPSSDFDPNWPPLPPRGGGPDPFRHICEVRPLEKSDAVQKMIDILKKTKPEDRHQAIVAVATLYDPDGPDGPDGGEPAPVRELSKVENPAAELVRERG